MINDLITIFTPTYNRKNELKRLYSSLMLLKNKFTWIIVDDGSTDETANFVASIKESSHFPIEYIFQSNSGKHIAINTGVSNCQSEWFFIVDSDDIVTSDCLEVIQEYVSKIPPHTSAICFRKGDLDGKLIGVQLSETQLLELSPNRAGELFKGDLAYVIQTKALKKNLFPKLNCENFVPELFIWNKIADHGSIFYHPSKIIYLCEYLPDGHSFNFKKTLKRNPLGFMIFYLDQVKRAHNLKLLLKSCIRFFQCVLYYLRKKH